MKTLTVIASIFLISIFYGAISFYSLELDFRQWSEGGRFFFLMFSFIVIFTMVMILGGLISDENEQKK